MTGRSIAWSGLLLAALATACESRHASVDAAEAMTGGDAARGRDLLRSYGCQTCHTIPGVDGADGLVGPPLGGIAARSYIGGVLPNSPENMTRWIVDPKGVVSLWRPCGKPRPCQRFSQGL